MPPCIHGHLSLTPVLNAATTTKEGHALCCRRACLKVEGALGPLVLTVTVVGWRLSVLPNRTYSSDRVIFANFVSYISAQDGPKFRAHFAQPASAQISKNISRNSGPSQVINAAIPVIHPSPAMSGRVQAVQTRRPTWGLLHAHLRVYMLSE